MFTKWTVLAKNSTVDHVHGMEKFSGGTLLYFISTKWKSLTGELWYFMSTKWKGLTGVIYNISCPQSAKVWLGGISTILHVHKVEKFNRRTLRYFMPTKWKSLTGVFYYISYPQSGKFNWGTLLYFNWRYLQYFMFTKWKILAVVLRIISCPRSGKL